MELGKKSILDMAKIMKRIMVNWNHYEITFNELVNGINVKTDNSGPYPFCLEYALEQEPEKLGDISEWQAEWKWDGIRGQIVKRNGELFIWSRGEELVTEQFPELHFMIDVLPDGVVLDGEILAVQDKQVLSFSTLQQRLNRKTINKKQLEDAPIGFFVYDILEYEAKDFREKPLSERRKILEQLIGGLDESAVMISPVINCNSWDELAELRQTSRSINSEGIMLRKLSSHYHSGRKRGDWWKWKVNP